MAARRDDVESPPVGAADWLLRSVLRGHLDLTRHVVLYGHLLKTWTARGRSSRDFTPAYTLAWLLVLAAVYSLSPIWAGRTWTYLPVLLIAAWRYLDLTLWYLGLLINSRHTRFAPVESNVLFLILDLLTIVFVGAILLRMTSSAYSIDGGWFSAFFLTTLTEIPPRLDFWDGVSQVMVASAGLLLLAGGLTVVLSVVSKRLSNEGDHVGPSHARHSTPTEPAGNPDNQE
jgi:hypothetical protein